MLFFSVIVRINFFFHNLSFHEVLIVILELEIVFQAHLNDLNLPFLILSDVISGSYLQRVSGAPYRNRVVAEIPLLSLQNQEIIVINIT